MDMRKLTSTNVDAAWWGNGQLVVRFTNGRQYAWTVPKEVFDGLMEADSPGQYVHEIEERFGKGVRQ